MASKPRTTQDINNDYFRKAAELGDLEWKLSKIPDQIKEIKRVMLKLDTEMDQAQGAELAKKLKDGANHKVDTTEPTPEEAAAPN